MFLLFVCFSSASMLALIGSGSFRLRVLPALLILQAEEDDLPDLAGGGTAPQEFGQHDRV
jgi:hypothetical protein